MDVVRELLADRTSPDSVDEEQQPVLCWAVLQDNFDVMVAILDAGAMVDKTDENGMTAMHHAVKNWQQARFVRRLLELVPQETSGIFTGEWHSIMLQKEEMSRLSSCSRSKLARTPPPKLGPFEISLERHHSK